MTVESFRVKQRSLRSSFTMCCTFIEDALKRDTSLPDLYALQRQIMDKFARLDTVQEHILELLLGDEALSGEYEDDFNKVEKYRDKMNQLSAELEYVVNKSLNKPQSEAEISQVMQNATGKIKLELSEFYDVLKSKLLALESIGRTQEKFADFFGAPRGVLLTGSRATGLGEV
ncbi:putative RNA-directed DNA polymerase from transposon X-element [Trichonephila clavipes]|nr:putative RNA-directed DNA polymerase from transposon X-element [Trichonephila clavipes]